MTEGNGTNDGQANREDEPIRLQRDLDLPLEPAHPIYTSQQQWHRRGPEPLAGLDADSYKSEPVPEQKPATILNIFTFPFSLSGILHFILFWFAPVFFTLFLPVTIIALSVRGAYFFLSVLFYAYFYYYLSACVIAAAKDERLAPDVSSEGVFTIGDLFSRLFLLLGAAGICFSPMTAYYLYHYFPQGPMWQTDNIYWLLFGISVFLFPMFLLAALMFDSLTGCNPLLIIGSIFSTFFPYCGLALLFFGVGFLMYRVWSLPRAWSLVSWGLDVYLTFIAAYILGRFFRRYE